MIHVDRAAVDRRWLALIVVLLATFMDLVDATIVNVALPVVQRDLDATYAAGQWMVAGYILPYALLLVTGGRLGDIVGRRRIFLVGVTGFTLASAAAGAAASPGMLIAARAAQGAFAGIMVPQALSVITAQFAPGRERTTAIRLYGALLGVAQVSGPILGGVLTHSGPGWRMIFYINIPIGLLALAGAARWMDDSRTGDPAPLDVPGVLLISAASLLLTYPLVQGRELGWPVWCVTMLVCAGPALVVFARYERRRERRGGAPLVPARLFAQRSFTAGLILMFVLFAGIAAYFITLTWGLQFGLGWSPLHLAITLLAWPAGIACTAQLTYRYGPPHARRLAGVGSAIVTAGTLGLAVTMARQGHGLTSWQLVPFMFGSGVGMGMTLPIMSSLVLSEVPGADAGAGSGVMNSVTQAGGAVGVALAGVVFFGGAADPSDLIGAAARTLAVTSAAFLLATLLSPLLPRGVSPEAQQAALPTTA